MAGLKWFNFSMSPKRSLSLGDGCRRDRVNRTAVERHMQHLGLRRSTLKFVQDRLVSIVLLSKSFGCAY
jgi:hypothetical protein